VRILSSFRSQLGNNFGTMASITRLDWSNHARNTSALFPWHEAINYDWRASLGEIMEGKIIEKHPLTRQ
jgi:hypothetical protein